jgi:hypothetical protein
MFDKKSRLNRMLLRAARRGDEEKAAFVLNLGAEIDVGKAKGKTPLIQAITAGQWSMACLLVEKGADVQGAPPEQKTPLLHAVERGDAAIVRLLLDAGASPDAGQTYTTVQYYERVNEDSGIAGFFKETSHYMRTTPHQLTPLTLAAHDGKSEIVRILLEAGARRDLRGKDDMTALACAEAQGHPRVAALLRAEPKPQPQPEPAPAPRPVEERPGDIVFKHALGACFLEEIYDFSARERISLIRKSEAGPVEISTRETFENIVDAPSLRAAFDEHVRRGGTVAEGEIFRRTMNKPRLNMPRTGLSGS